MAEYSLYGKKKLCYTDVLDYTDFQGIGKDPLYKRYDSVKSVVKRYIPNEFQHFLSQPIYDDNEDVINWYVEDWQTEPKRFSELSANQREEYMHIKEQTLKVYKECLHQLSGDDRLLMCGALKYIHDDAIFCYDGKVVLVAWGMKPDAKRHVITGSVIHDFVVKKKFTILFDAGEHGRFKHKLDEKLQREEGYELSKEDIPVVVADEGYLFKEWIPSPYGLVITQESCFKACYEPVPSPVIEEPVEVEEPDEPEEVEEVKEVEEPEKVDSPLSEPEEVEEETLPEEEEAPEENKDESLEEVTEEKVEKIPWYKLLWEWLARFWKWFTSEDVKKWIKRILIALLLLLLLVLLSRACSSCDRNRDNHSHNSRGAAPVERITTPDGTTIDNNNRRAPGKGIIRDDGSLPNNQSFVVAPIRGDQGAVPPIHKEPGKPTIIANRLNIYFEDQEVSLQAFANAFKELYPGEAHQIIGFDDHVKMIQIQIPEEERNTIRENLPAQLPDFKFFIVDESLFKGFGFHPTANKLNGWHLKAINVPAAWQITKGNAEIVVAVIDDGLDYTHPMFEGRIVHPYNVFTQDNRLSLGEGHGTHVAGLAVGSTQYLQQGAAGIAPACQLMPVQVFDNEFCTFSSVTSGIMYAIHRGADVINLSIGMSFDGLSQLPVDQQRALSGILCTNEELVWRKIIGIANKKNCILVFAVGNDKVLATIPPENRVGSSINVAAIDPSLRAAKFSNFGDGSNISAPGVAIYSAYPKHALQSCDGTSMAAPIVTGTIALMRSIDPKINVREVLNVLTATGKKTDQRVPPMIQVDKALRKVQTGHYANEDSDATSHTSDEAGENSQTDHHEENKQTDHRDENIQSGNQQTNEPDYDKIRALIEEYKRKIKELEQLLPKNKKN